MNGWCKIIAELPDGWVIRYSLEDNRSCDGLLFFEKVTKKITITLLSRGATEESTQDFIYAVRGRIRWNFKLNKLYHLTVS